MISKEMIEQNKQRYIELVCRLDGDVKGLIEHLDMFDFFTMPATTQYNFSYAGGLCEKALKVCHELGVLCNAYFPGKYTEEDIIKVALLRDIYRAEMYEASTRNVKDPTTGTWSSVPFYKVTDNKRVFGDIGFSSYMVAKDFISFTDEEIEAIVHSTGVKNDQLEPYIYEVNKQFPLTVLTKMADLVVNNFSEETIENG